MILLALLVHPIISFADDAVALVPGQSRRRIEQKFTTITDILLSWVNEVKLTSISVTKSKGMIT